MLLGYTAGYLQSATADDVTVKIISRRHNMTYTNSYKYIFFKYILK